MLAAVRDGALYDEIRKAGLQDHVWQWQSLLAPFCQNWAFVLIKRPAATER